MPKTYYIFLGVACIICLGLGFFLTSTFYCKCEGEKVLSLKDIGGEGKEEGRKEIEDCDFFVDVSGAVMNPGVVCVHDGAIVNDAIVKAQGFNPSAYAFKYVAQRVNLAKILESEEKIYIPFRDDVVCKRVENEQVKYVEGVMKSIGLVDTGKGVESAEVVQKEVVNNVAEKVVEDDCINLNTASKEKIMELKGIGEAKATDIMEGRPYSKIEDLQNVKGIGEKTFENF